MKKMNSWIALSVFLIFSACSVAHRSPDKEFTRLHVEQTGQSFTIVPLNVSFEVKPSCKSSPQQCLYSKKEIRREMREKARTCQPAYDLTKKVADGKDLFFMFSDCDIDCLLLYASDSTTDKIESDLRYYIPGTMKRHQFYLAGDCEEGSSSPSFYFESGWSIVTFPYGVDFGDGDGAAMRVTYCFKTYKNKTLLMVFILNRCTIKPNRWPGKFENILGSFK